MIGECPRCRRKDFEIVKDEVDIGVGIQTHVMGGAVRSMWAHHTL
jgi:hypothetical protein